MGVQPIPEGSHSVTPYLVVERAGNLIDFLKKAFDAKEIHHMTQPDGTIMHAEVRIGDSLVMLGDACGEHKPMPCYLHLYVPDVDAVYQRALQAGAVSVREPADQFYGDRSAGVRDPAGNFWGIGTHKEDVAPDEIARRAQAAATRQRAASR
jgi:PhnB protein